MELLIDVRDLAEALLLIYEKPEAHGRYICSSHSLKTEAFVEKIKCAYPNLKYPKRQEFFSKFLRWVFLFLFPFSN